MGSEQGSFYLGLQINQYGNSFKLNFAAFRGCFKRLYIGVASIPHIQHQSPGRYKEFVKLFN